MDYERSVWRASFGVHFLSQICAHVIFSKHRYVKYAVDHNMLIFWHIQMGPLAVGMPNCNGQKSESGSCCKLYLSYFGPLAFGDD